jgi:magnesium chelatase subunit D
VPVDSAESSALDVAATLLAAAPHQRSRSVGGLLKLERRDVRVKLRRARARRCTLFVVDASGSMAARRRMAAAKGAVVSLLRQAYQQRDEVGLIAFRGLTAELLLPLTTSVEMASNRLRYLPTGGRTPLAAALRLASAVLVQRGKVRGAAGSDLVVVVSDGRANVAIGDGDPAAEALDAAHALGASGVGALVVDSEDGPVRLGLARQLCTALNGQYLRLADLLGANGGANPLTTAVQSAHGAR